MNDLIPINDLQTMAIAIAKSGLFGAKTPDQALALMLVAQAEGLHPASAARDYDIIQGKGAKKSEAMLRDFLKAGGTVRWHALDDTKADATFAHPAGGEVRIVWDMARAARAELSDKPMYKKFSRQMLRARCVSEGVRTVCPMATGGMYTPEEVQDIPERDMGNAERVDVPGPKPKTVPKPEGDSPESRPRGEAGRGAVPPATKQSAAEQEPGPSTKEGQREPPAAAANGDTKPLTEGQVRVLKAKLINAGLSTADFEKRFGVALEAGALAPINRCLAWILDPANV